MSPAKLIFCVAAGVVLGGAILGAGWTYVGRTGTEATVANGGGPQITRRFLVFRKSCAQQIGLGAIRYSADHDDLLPGPNDFTSKVGPYLAPDVRGVVGFFVWTFPGGKQPDFSNLKYTELGHFEDKAGTTTLYADGQVRQSLARSVSLDPLP